MKKSNTQMKNTNMGLGDAKQYNTIQKLKLCSYFWFWLLVSEMPTRISNVKAIVTDPDFVF